MDRFFSILDIDGWLGDAVYYLFRRLPARLKARFREWRHRRELRGMYPEPVLWISPKLETPRQLNLGWTAIMTTLVLAIIVGVAVSFSFPDREKREARKAALAKPAKPRKTTAAVAKTEPVVPVLPKAECKPKPLRCVARVVLPADGSKSAVADIDDVVPDTWNYSFSGPRGAIVYWLGFGDSGPLASPDGKRDWGVRDGPVQFSAPAGTIGEIVIPSHPPTTST